MKLNNRGFALTSMIYMLIVLFLLLLLLILGNLASRKVVLDKIKYDVKNKFDQGATNTLNTTLYDTLIRYYYSDDNIGKNGYSTIPGQEISYGNEGLIVGQDDSGISYYFRGNVVNNYVSFADKLFRIVRVNGDGSIRLILDNGIGEYAFNNDGASIEYNGFTYNRDSEETNSSIKDYLNDWYFGTGVFASDTNSLVNYEKYIASTNYCNDTSSYVISNYDSSNVFYGGHSRLNPTTGLLNAHPILNCPITFFNYGGSYNMKVGLISADEVAFAGGIYYDSSLENNHYLSSGSFLTMTPYKYLSDLTEKISACLSSSNCSDDYDLNNDGIVNNSDLQAAPLMTPSGYTFGVSNGFLFESMVSDKLTIRPVINLNKDVLVSTGNGTFENPYVISSQDKIAFIGKMTL